MPINRKNKQIITKIVFIENKWFNAYAKEILMMVK